MIWMWSANSEKEKVRDKKKNKIDELRMQDGRKVIRLEKRDKDANRIHVWLFRIEIKKKMYYWEGNCLWERSIV